MSLKTVAVFAALLFALALVNAPPAAACDTGGVQPGNPTFSFTAPQQVYAPQAFVAAQPVVTQQFVAQPQYVQQFVAQPVIQRQVAFHHQQAVVQQVVAQPVLAVRQPRRQVTRSSTVTRTGGVLGFRN